MPSGPVIRRIYDILWPGGTGGDRGVFAILDGARDRKVFAAVDACRRNKTCLHSVNVRWYGEDLPWATIGTAPYLVELDRDDEFTRLLLGSGWDGNWGILFRSDSSLEKLRKHFRRFLTVSDERRKRLVFRYYDPRVLRVYLPTCRLQELETVFGPVGAYIVPGGEPDTALEFRFSGTRLLRRVARLNEDASASGYSDDLAVRSLSSPSAEHGGLVIRDAQMKALRGNRTQEFQERMLDHVRKFFARQCAAAGEERMRELIQDGVGRAARWGFTAERDVCKFIDLMVEFGARFENDAQHEWAQRILLGGAGVPASAKMDELFRAALAVRTGTARSITAAAGR